FLRSPEGCSGHGIAPGAKRVLLYRSTPIAEMVHVSRACIGGPRWWAVPLLTLLLGIPAPGCSQSPESTSEARGVVEDLQPEPESAPGSIAALSEGVDASRRN